jgi:hypothetical protein
MKVTELKRIFCGKKNSYRKLLKIKLVPKESRHASVSLSKNCKMMHIDTETKNLQGGFNSIHNISRRPDHN